MYFISKKTPQQDFNHSRALELFNKIKNSLDTIENNVDSIKNGLDSIKINTVYSTQIKTNLDSIETNIDLYKKEIPRITLEQLKEKCGKFKNIPGYEHYIDTIQINIELPLDHSKKEELKELLKLLHEEKGDYNILYEYSRLISYIFSVCIYIFIQVSPIITRDKLEIISSNLSEYLNDYNNILSETFFGNFHEIFKSYVDEKNFYTESIKLTLDRGNQRFKILKKIKMNSKKLEECVQLIKKNSNPELQEKEKPNATNTDNLNYLFHYFLKSINIKMLFSQFMGINISFISNLPVSEEVKNEVKKLIENILINNNIYCIIKNSYDTTKELEDHYIEQCERILDYKNTYYIKEINNKIEKIHIETTNMLELAAKLGTKDILKYVIINSINLKTKTLSEKLKLYLDEFYNFNTYYELNKELDPPKWVFKSTKEKLIGGYNKIKTKKSLKKNKLKIKLKTNKKKYLHIKN